MTSFIEKARIGRTNALEIRANSRDVLPFTRRVRSQHGHSSVFFTSSRTHESNEAFVA